MLGAQDRLDFIERALGRTPRFRLIQSCVSFQLGQLDRALALIQPLTERQDGIAPGGLHLPGRCLPSRRRRGGARPA